MAVCSPIPLSHMPIYSACVSEVGGVSRVQLQGTAKSISLLLVPTQFSVKPVRDKNP